MATPMPVIDALDVAVPLLIALGALPIAAGIARLALKALITAVMASQESTGRALGPRIVAPGAGQMLTSSLDVRAPAALRQSWAYLVLNAFRHQMVTRSARPTARPIEHLGPP